MKAKKAIVIQLMKDLEGLEITKKILDDCIRSLADEDAGFESKFFDIGVKALIKEYGKLSCKDSESDETDTTEYEKSDYPLSYHEIESDEELELLTGLRWYQECANALAIEMERTLLSRRQMGF